MNKYISNNLLLNETVNSLSQDTSQSRSLYDFLRQLYDDKRPEHPPPAEKDPEDSLCNIWLTPILQKLGWHFAAQQKTIPWEGTGNKIDCSLYPGNEEATSLSLPLTFLEAKKLEHTD